MTAPPADGPEPRSAPAVPGPDPAVPGSDPARRASNPAVPGPDPARDPDLAAPGSDPSLPGARLAELVQVMDTLRVSCPWDARQTHASLAPHLLEETYEALDALAGDDPAAVREELGDVLLQVVFHARVAQERTDGTGYDIDDVAAGIVDKLTRRHPHVFGDVAVDGPDQVLQNWDTIKAAERAAKAGGSPASALDGVPMGQPALSLAAQLLRRAQRAGVPPELADAAPDPAGGAAEAAGGPAEAAGGAAEAAGSAAEAAGGAAEAAAAATAPVAATAAGHAAGADGPVARPASGAGGELGQELLALVARAQAAGLDPELELRAAARAYADRVRAWEAERRA
jgi:NTP pyrophosphatase (non-canonical NTP hydrolase)